MANPLPSFEGRPVIKATVKIAKAGDGLSEALKLAPVALHLGDEAHFVIKGVVTQVNHKPVEAEADEQVRQHTVDAIEIAMVDEDDVAELLARNADRVKEAKEQARLAEEQEAGIMRLDVAEETAEELLEREQAEAEREAKADVEAADELEKARGRRAAGRGK